MTPHFKTAKEHIMVKTKRRRILFAIGTIALAAAGTGLTLMNNIDVAAYNENIMSGLLITGIALALAACFTAMEIAFLWTHKELDDTRKTWRKAVLGATAIVLICIMGFAMYEELKITLAKIGNKSLASNSAMVVKEVRGRQQASVARVALQGLQKGKLETNAIPFVLGYVAAGIAFVIIAMVAEQKRQRRVGAGNLLAFDPDLAERVKSQFDNISLDQLRAYQDRSGKGASVWHKSRQIGYLPYSNKPVQARDKNTSLN